MESKTLTTELGPPLEAFYHTGRSEGWIELYVLKFKKTKTKHVSFKNYTAKKSMLAKS